MKYRQLGGEERSVLAALRLVGLKPAEIARELGRHRSTVSRELKRNAAPYDGWYRARRAQQRAHARRYRSRRNSQFGHERDQFLRELVGAVIIGAAGDDDVLSESAMAGESDEVGAGFARGIGGARDDRRLLGKFTGLA